MKVFILGGYGAVGLPSAEMLAKSDLVTEIVLAGRNMERAELAAAEIGDKVRAVQVDGADEKQLASLLAGYDIIVNTASNQVALPVLQAAVSASAHYCASDGGGILSHRCWNSRLRPEMRVLPRSSAMASHPVSLISWECTRPASWTRQSNSREDGIGC